MKSNQDGTHVKFTTLAVKKEIYELVNASEATTAAAQCACNDVILSYNAIYCCYIPISSDVLVHDGAKAHTIFRPLEGQMTRMLLVTFTTAAEFTYSYTYYTVHIPKCLNFGARI